MDILVGYYKTVGTGTPRCDRLEPKLQSIEACKAAVEYGGFAAEQGSLMEICNATQPNMHRPNQHWEDLHDFQKGFSHSEMSTWSILADHTRAAWHLRTLSS